MLHILLDCSLSNYHILLKMTYLLALISILFGSLAQLFLKMGVVQIGRISFSTDCAIKAAANLSVWTGIIFYGMSLVLWFAVLSKLELSRAYPMVSLGYVFAMAFSYLWLGESITLTKVIGILMIVSGVYFISR